MFGRVEVVPAGGCQGGQGRPEAARRGSLEGPVRIPPGIIGLRSRLRLRWMRCSRCLGGGTLRFVLQVSTCCSGGVSRFPGRRSSIRHGDGGMEGFGRSQTGSIKRATTPPQGGGHEKVRLASGCAGRVSSRLGQATDVSVAQAVVDEGPKLACRGDPADGTASVLGDTVMERGDGGGATLAAHGLDRRPAHQPRALFICSVSVSVKWRWPSVVLGRFPRSV